MWSDIRYYPIYNASMFRLLLKYHGSSSSITPRACPDCQAPPYQAEEFVIGDSEDWMEPFILYLCDNVLPSDKRAAAKLSMRAKRFLYHAGILYRRSFGGDLLRFLGKVEADTVLKEFHEKEHQGKRRLFLQVHEKNCWPTMEEDAASFVRKCHKCQTHADLIHAPSVPLHSVSSPWPFNSCGT
ncbi:uncharacterized protein LOC113333795 [Papaver somniferum]|uniref:uncharacterized protein LOC113333795 n=1 Tax=Papaver somniferum TaxID=3469 RepID=UPI000E7046A1|nr:uncharacterized protein LOC113333795 [Papaver somniferum]